MRVAAVQMVSTPDPVHNLARAGELLAQAAQAGAQLVALPEYFCLMGQRDTDKLDVAETPGSGPLQEGLSHLARQHQLWIVAGTLPLRSPQTGKVWNSSLVIDPQGQTVARYDKMHLFGFDNGRERYDEAQVLLPGSNPTAFAWPHAQGVWRVGLAICYDLRFPELFRALHHSPLANWPPLAAPPSSTTAPTARPCDLVVVPAAFTHTTGLAHWELLLRTRAVENQCYVLASAQGGLHENGRRTYGHSLIVDPWGEVITQQAEGEGVVCADLDPARLAQVRSQLPALDHRRWKTHAPDGTPLP